MAAHFTVQQGTSPEAIAYLLLLGIARNERKGVRDDGTIDGADKQWILDTYAECLLTVKAPHER